MWVRCFGINLWNLWVLYSHIHRRVCKKGGVGEWDNVSGGVMGGDQVAGVIGMEFQGSRVIVA
jgi:hypothetical protein